MFCEKCGAQLDENSRFCVKCGSPVSNQSVEEREGDVLDVEQQKNLENSENIPQKSKKKKAKRIVILICILLILAVGGGFAFSFWGLPQILPVPIDTQKSFSVTVAGYNGYAELKYGFNFSEEFIESIQENSHEKLDWTNQSELEKLLNSIQVEVSKESNLSNNDEITFTYNYDEELEKELGVQLIFMDTPYKVSGLKDLTTFDPFDGFELSFSGYDYYGTAEAHPKMGAYSDYVTYEISDNGGLYNGEKITVTAVFDSGVALERGFRVDQEQKEFEVSGLTALDDTVIFGGVDLRFAGATPKILATIQNMSTDPLLSQITYQMDRSENLSEGDIITVTAVLPKRNESAQVNRTFTKEFPVELSGAAAEVEPIYLEDMLAANTDHYVTDRNTSSFIGKIGTYNGNKDTSGVEYEHGLVMHLNRVSWEKEQSWVWNEYEIPAGYTHFRGVLTLLERSENKGDFDVTLQILGDDQELYSAVLRPGFGIGEINLDISGVSRLKISVIDNVGAKTETSFLLGDARFE